MNLNRFLCGRAQDLLRNVPENSVDVVVTSPPYWDAVSYDVHDVHESYEDYLQGLNAVWQECVRVLRPNGKLCINAPLMPIPKAAIAQHTRHLKNISGDIDHEVLTHTPMQRFSTFVWQKQTSKLMFGSYPYPGNILENNTIEFISVFVKPGKPPKFSQALKDENKLSRTEWLDLTQQVWFVYPADVKRAGGHPAPFPEKIPARLIRLYTYSNEVVLDPFVGTGTTCVAAHKMNRHWLGIDVSPQYISHAEQRLASEPLEAPLLLTGRPKYMGKEELQALAAQEAGTAGPLAERQHKRKTYGR